MLHKHGLLPQVGSYKDGQLNLQTNLINFYQILDGACVGTMCDHCSQANTTQSTTRATTLATPVDTDSFSLADFVIIGILGLLLITIITVCIIIVCCLKSRVRGRKTVSLFFVCSIFLFVFFSFRGEGI